MRASTDALLRTACLILFSGQHRRPVLCVCVCAAWWSQAVRDETDKLSTWQLSQMPKTGCPPQGRGGVEPRERMVSYSRSLAGWWRYRICRHALVVWSYREQSVAELPSLRELRVASVLARGVSAGVRGRWYSGVGERMRATFFAFSRRVVSRTSRRAP